MSMCEAVSDRMPGVASGQTAWTEAERAHLVTCGDCAAEWQLVSVAARLGRDVTVNADRIAPLVVSRVRSAKQADERQRKVRWMVKAGGLAIAALLLLILVPRRRSGEVPATPAGVAAQPAELQLAELDDAAPTELEMVLVEFDEPAVPASSLDGPDLEGLDVSQLERALRSWEES